MTSDEIEYPTIDQFRESWRSLHHYYQTHEADIDYRFRYILDRLIDSELTQRFMVGEAFQMPWHIGANAVDLTLPHSRSAGRALYFTLAQYGATLAETPHVAMYFCETQLMASYCRGSEVIITNICQSRKEIPCLISLLDMLWRDRDLPSPPSWRETNQ